MRICSISSLRLVFIVGLCVFGAVAAAQAMTTTTATTTTTTAAPSDRGPPFVLGVRRSAHGVVTAVDVAGHYAYVTVRADDGSSSVTAILGSDVAVGDVVDRTLFGHRDVFESKRLHKIFAPLDFGVVSPFTMAADELPPRWDFIIDKTDNEGRGTY